MSQAGAAATWFAGPVRRALRTSVLSALAFSLAALVGRQAVLPGTELALVWPAAGIAGVWVAAHASSRWCIVDCVLLFAASALVNAATGAGPVLAIGIGLAAVVQALVMVVLLARWTPELSGFGDHPPDGLRGTRDVGLLLAAATTASVCSALIGPATVLALRDQDWAVVVSWVVRNTTGVIAVFPLALVAPSLVRGGPRAARRSLTGAQWGELVGLLVATGLGLWLVLGIDSDLPLPFVLITTCVWAGARFGPVLAGSYAVLLSGVVVGVSAGDLGPFAEIAAGYQRALVVQTFVLVVVLVTLSLSVARRENVLLNSALAASGRAARDQALLLQTIVDSMADGVSVVDGQGRLVMRNPAAGRLIGAALVDEHGALELARYNFAHLDGTPLLPGEAPFDLARAHGSAIRADYVLQSSAATADRVLDVTATPLDDGEEANVVVVYHDVTAERRERDELASFAGVVAHDLMNPLTVIESWTTIMVEDATLSSAPDAAEQLDHLERIQRSGRRMRDLIDDLLAFTTARDLAIDPVPVDTTAVVREIAQARVEAAGVVDGVEPRVSVGVLPGVLAEPVLLRQVFDNLIGNAIKYVAPGTRPHIEITGRAAAAPPGYVELVVADNGIGIPADQRASVFETFHRAHREGYRGTGLGLSIVKRVVERHGGTVTAGERPGGGTLITLCLPAAPVPAPRIEDDPRSLDTPVKTSQ